MNELIIIAGKYLYLVSMLIAVIYFLVVNREKKIDLAKLAIPSLILSYLVAKIAGKLYYDPRPFMVDHIKPLIAHAAGNGFPSDHTLLTMAIASIVFIYNKKLGIILAVISLIVGFARVAAHIHHSIDIAGSIIIAWVSTYGVLFFLTKFFSKKKTS